MSATIDLTPDELLSTTRAVRKRLDLERPVPMEVVRECMELALQAPSGSNVQGWHFVFVTDADKRRRIAEYYRKSFEGYRDSPMAASRQHQDDPDLAPVQQRVMSSAEYLAEHMHEVPVLLIPCVEGRVEELGVAAQAGTYGSIVPAVWSFMLAARSRGLGTCWTSLHLPFEKEVAEIVGIPHDRVTQVALVPVAYTKGTDFKPAARKPLDDVMHVDAW